MSNSRNSLQKSAADFSSGASRPLGIYAESSSLIDFKGVFSGGPETVQVDPETGEIRSETWSYSAALVERYALQAQARRSMLEHHRGQPDEGSKLHKVTRCRRWLRPPRPGESIQAEVFKHRDTGRTHYGGLEVCGSSWACPVCASKIAERRSDEIRKAVDQWIASGGVCFFVTLTVPHYACDGLQGMVQGFRKALERFRGGKAFQALKRAIGYAGMIRALEVTWGEVNGWHPHSHEICFCRLDDPDSFPVGELLERWQDCAEASGFRRPSCRGLTVRKVETEAEARERLADYCAKFGVDYDPDRPLWGAADELTRAHSKRGRSVSKRDQGRFTPWDFLREQYNPEASTGFKLRCRALFAEYVTRFKGLAQVFWSRGLKSQFDLDDLTDEEVAEDTREPGESLAIIEPEDWAKVIYRRDYRADLLLIAQAGGAPALREFLASLPSSAGAVGESAASAQSAAASWASSASCASAALSSVFFPSFAGDTS